MRATSGARGSAILAVVVLLFSVGCKKEIDTITGIFATRTPVPTRTPTPAPSAFLHGRLLFATGNYSGLNGPANILVFQGTRTFPGTQAIDGSYEVPGLEPGAASIAVLGQAQNQTVKGGATPTLALGENILDVQLKVQP